MSDGITQDGKKIAFPYLGGIGIGIVVLSALSATAAQFTGWVAAVGISLLVFFSAAAVGAAFGFLFAVPRLLSDLSVSDGDLPAAKPDKRPGAADSGAPGTLSSRLLRSNTNLERISDWLTTMLVGVGLSQIGAIGTTLGQFSEFLAKSALVFPGASGMAPSAGALPAVGPMILIFGVVTGFLCVYVYTRVILSGLFNQAERDLTIAPERAQVSAKVAGAVVQEARALSAQTTDPELSALANAKTVSVGDALSIMFNLLYEPQGYLKVIKMAADLEQSPAAQSPQYWYYLAAAHGQQHREAREGGADPTALAKARLAALKAARQAVALDRSYADRLLAIADPNDVDNDLADFRDDPEFRRITRRVPTRK